MILFFKRVIKDLWTNFFLNGVTVLTIALSVLIFSSFTLFFMNAESIIRLWMKDMRIMAYIKPQTPPKIIQAAQRTLKKIPDVKTVRFVSKAEALKRFKKQLDHQASLLDHLKTNPLPDAFEISLSLSPQNWERIEPVAVQIEAVFCIEEVEYGQQWLGKVFYILNLFRLTGYGMGALFFTAVAFFVANTIRLVLYSRRDEVEIMRLVGASEGFIKDPFYLQSLMMGGLGGAIGMGTLFMGFRLMTQSVMGQSFSAAFPIYFFPLEAIAAIVGGSMFVGWLGCYFSMRQFLKF